MNTPNSGLPEERPVERRELLRMLAVTAAGVPLLTFLNSCSDRALTPLSPQVEKRAPLPYEATALDVHCAPCCPLCASSQF